MQRLHLIVTGEVQGVGFRWHVQRAARLLGLHGEVRNRADGAVTVEAEGDRDALESLAAAAREGPAGAIVAGVETRWSEGPARYRDFAIGPTS
jgi:Acylphosphatases